MSHFRKTWAIVWWRRVTDLTGSLCSLSAELAWHTSWARCRDFYAGAHAWGRPWPCWSVSRLWSLSAIAWTRCPSTRWCPSPEVQDIEPIPGGNYHWFFLHVKSTLCVCVTGFWLRMKYDYFNVVFKRVPFLCTWYVTSIENWYWALTVQAEETLTKLSLFEYVKSTLGLKFDIF